MIAVDDGQHIGDIGEKPLVDGWFCHEMLCPFSARHVKELIQKRL
jgi:hypothetical protein